MLSRLYWVICGATAAYRVPALIPALTPLTKQLFTFPTPNAQQIISARDLARVPGHQLILTYFDAAILPRPTEGVILIAPCTFNSLNKLAHGLADNLPLSLAQDAIGSGWQLVVAPSFSSGLWRHPQRERSIKQLEEWGVKVIVPAQSDDYAMATNEQIIATIQQIANNYS